MALQSANAAITTATELNPRRIFTSILARNQLQLAVFMPVLRRVALPTVVQSCGSAATVFTQL
jgi:hypothetical protein